MKRSDLIKKLIQEGISEKTLVNFSDKQIISLSERMLGEQPVQTKNVQITSVDTKTPEGKKMAADLLNNPKSLKGHYEVKEGKGKLSKSQSNKMDTDKDGDIDSTDLKNLRSKKKTEVKEDDVKLGRGFEKKYNDFNDGKKGETKKDDVKLGRGFEKKYNDFNDGKKGEVKEWVNKLVENNYHSFTSKNEIMELIQTKMVQHEVGPNVKKGHNDVPEFMSYDAITKSEVKEDDVKTKPKVKPTTEPSKPKPKTPYQPGPGKDPKPKAGLKESKK